MLCGEKLTCDIVWLHISSQWRLKVFLIHIYKGDLLLSFSLVFFFFSIFLLCNCLALTVTFYFPIYSCSTLFVWFHCRFYLHLFDPFFGIGDLWNQKKTMSTVREGKKKPKAAMEPRVISWEERKSLADKDEELLEKQIQDLNTWVLIFHSFFMASFFLYVRTIDVWREIITTHYLFALYISV